MKKILIVLLSLVLFGSLTAAQAADEPKAVQPAQDMPMLDHKMMKGADGNGMMDCPMMKDGDSKCMQKPEAGGQQKEAPMEHKH